MSTNFSLSLSRRLNDCVNNNDSDNCGTSERKIFFCLFVQHGEYIKLHDMR